MRRLDRPPLLALPVGTPGVDARRRPAMRPVSLILLSTAAVVLVASFAAAASGASSGAGAGLSLPFLAAAGSLVALVLAARDADRAQRAVVAATAAGLAFLAIGLFVWSRASTDSGMHLVAILLLLGAAMAIAGFLLIAFLRDLDRCRLSQITLDGLAVVLATAAVLAPVWLPIVAVSRVTADVASALAAVGMVAIPVAGYLALLDRRLRPGWWGPYAMLHALLVGGCVWIIVLPSARLRPGEIPEPMDLALAAAVLLVAWGAVTWNPAPPAGPRFDRWAQLGVDVFPAAAVAVALAAALLGRGQPHEGAVMEGLALVVSVALARQVLLVRQERRARSQELAASERLAREIQHRAELDGARHRYRVRRLLHARGSPV